VSPTPAPAAALLQAVEVRVLALPSVDELLEKKHEVYVFEKTFTEARWEPTMIL
jgi:hypothetical protein